LADRGFVRFLGRGQLDELYAPFPERTIDLLSNTLHGSNLVEYWNVTARRPA
jgi:hypothetical protein